MILFLNSHEKQSIWNFTSHRQVKCSLIKIHSNDATDFFIKLTYSMIVNSVAAHKRQQTTRKRLARKPRNCVFFMCANIFGRLIKGNKIKLKAKEKGRERRSH